MNDSIRSNSTPSDASSIGAAGPTPRGPDLRTRPLHEDISACARELWRKYGCPVGRDEEIWLEAERQILGADPEVARLDGQPTAADALNQSAISGSTASPGGEGRDPREDLGGSAKTARAAKPEAEARSPRRRQTVR